MLLRKDCSLDIFRTGTGNRFPEGMTLLGLRCGGVQFFFLGGELFSATVTVNTMPGSGEKKKKTPCLLT